ncbi:MAG TPA: hypothetical protein VN941_08200 [Bradyrhizobium sp.]|nr:hypothetical protein [Bradyrhizobium sp.]
MRRFTPPAANPAIGNCGGKIPQSRPKIARLAREPEKGWKLAWARGICPSDHAQQKNDGIYASNPT